MRLNAPSSSHSSTNLKHEEGTSCFPLSQRDIDYSHRLLKAKIRLTMVKLTDDGVTKKFKAVFAKLKGRRRTDSTKAKMAVACIDEPAEIDLTLDLVTTSMDSMDLSTSASLPIAPSGTFDFRPPPSTPKWPGPRYDDLVQVVPGIFNRSPEMMLPRGKSKPKHKRAQVKRSTSHDDRHAVRRLDSKVSKPSATKIKKQTMPKKPQFCPPPPARDEPLHLLSLPGEIRNQIYRYLYVSKEPLQAQFRPILRPHQGTAKPLIKRFPREPTLALACKQLRNEASSLFYAENTFVFAKCTASTTDPSHLWPMTRTRTLTRWMSASNSTAALTRIELRLGGDLGRGLDEYTRQNVKYTFSRLADGSTAVKQDVTEATRCLCLDRKVLDDALPEMAKEGAPARENLLHAATLLVATRNVVLAGVVRKVDSRICVACGKPGWRRPGDTAR